VKTNELDEHGEVLMRLEILWTRTSGFENHRAVHGSTARKLALTTNGFGLSVRPELAEG
jgi:hypothetical protein